MNRLNMCAAAILAACAALAGCSTCKNTAMTGRWDIESVYGTVIEKNTQNPCYLEIDTEAGRIGGYDGCNSIGGSFIKGKRGKISVKGMMSTARYCPDQGGCEMLGKAAGSAVSCKSKTEGGKQYLIFKDNSGKVCLKLYKNVP